MKHWRVDYTIKYIDGREEELEATFETYNIAMALGMAINNVREPLLCNPDVNDVVIWNIAIVNDDVFPEEGDPDDH